MSRFINNKQSGFIVLMGMLLLVLGAATWFGTVGMLKSNSLKIEFDVEYKTQLNLIKQRMLSFAVLHPEIYSDASVEPGPGYFPCPDTDGDGNAESICGSPGADDQLFVYGMVPYKIAGRNFTFVDSDLDNKLFWYALDARFVNNSQVFTSYANNRFAELNNNLDIEVSQLTGADSAPLLLDGEDEIVMVLFYAGQALASQNRSSISIGNFLEQPTITDGYATDFNSVDVGGNFNDYVIAITRSEWEAAVLSRVSRDADENGEADFCTAIADTDVHWFNDCVYNSLGNTPGFSCTYDSAATDNIAGQGWRTIACP